ncbi:MAG: flagellar biosynthesis anti-sigma factor FlgM [Deltaproteobacteria bacterium]|nr:flagellar biosynthesis anti-sigma factor FlgM [Deltaproteobacteria bacterium]
MKKPKKPGPGKDAPPGNHHGNGAPNWGRCCPRWPGASNLQRNEKLMEQVRQIIAATSEVRPEKVEPLQEAVASGTYEIDARKLANSLITKIILES